MDKNKLRNKNVRSRIIAAVVAVVAILISLAPGVDGDGDITNKFVAIVLGLDYDDGALTVTMTSLLPEPGSAEGGTVVSVPVSASGASITECFHNIEAKTGKSLELGLCGAVVIGDGIAKEGVLTTASILLSGAIVSPGAYLVQADGVSAEDVIRKSTLLTYNSSTILSELIKNAEKSTGNIPVTLLKFVSDSSGKAESAFAPIVTMREAPKLSGDAGGESGGGGNEKFEPMEISRSALYKRGRLVGSLSTEASRGLSYSDKHNTKGALVCRDFVLSGVNVGTLSASVTKCGFSVDTSIKDGIPSARLKVSVSLKATDRERVNAVAMQKNLTYAQLDDAFRENFSKVVESEVRKAYEEAKSFDCDVFEIEQKLYRFHTKDYKKFVETGKSLLEECNTEITAEITVI